MTTDASGLHCPNCGAAADPAAGRCPYCRTRLATMSCPGCFGLMFQGAAFCPRCGAAAARVAAGSVAAACPACRGAMARVIVGEASLLECAGCDGVWLDAADFERVCADREAQAAVIHRTRDPAPIMPEAAVKYRPCLTA